jgi:hypothetical protein
MPPSPGRAEKVPLWNGPAPLAKDQQAAQFGDSQFDVEETLPKDATAVAGAFVVVTPDGETPPHALLAITCRSLSLRRPPSTRCPP